MTDEERRDEVTQLALENRARIWGFVMALCKDPARTQVIFGETYLVICDQWENYEPGSDFLDWVLTIVRFEYLKSLPPDEQQQVASEADVLEQAIKSAESSSLPLAMRYNALRQCMPGLDSRARKAVELRYDRHMPTDEVARKLDLSVPAYYLLMARVRNALHKCVVEKTGLVESES